MGKVVHSRPDPISSLRYMILCLILTGVGFYLKIGPVFLILSGRKFPPESSSGPNCFFLVLNLETEYMDDYELKAILIRKDYTVESHSNLG
jgi:hypothetical protein